MAQTACLGGGSRRAISRLATSMWDRANPSSFCTAIQPGRISGATSFLTSVRIAGVWRPILREWVGPASRRPRPTALSTTPAPWMRGSTRCSSPGTSRWSRMTAERPSASIAPRRHREQIKAIAYYEAVAHSRRWDDFPGGRDRQFRTLRSPEGERVVLDENVFVEVVLPRGILRKLTDDEMEAYRAPYRDRERRLPTLIWPRELPIDGDPEDVVAIVDENARWLAANDRLPKLFINGDPGVIQTGRLRKLVRAFPNQREVTLQGLASSAGGLTQRNR